MFAPRSTYKFLEKSEFERKYSKAVARKCSTEAATGVVPYKKVLLKISQNSQENTSVIVLVKI